MRPLVLKMKCSRQPIVYTVLYVHKGVVRRDVYIGDGRQDASMTRPRYLGRVDTLWRCRRRRLANLVALFISQTNRLTSSLLAKITIEIDKRTLFQSMATLNRFNPALIDRLWTLSTFLGNSVISIEIKAGLCLTITFRAREIISLEMNTV